MPTEAVKGSEATRAEAGEFGRKGKYTFIISKAKRGTPVRDRCVPGLVFTQPVVAFGSSRARTSVALGQAGQSREGPQRSQGCPMTRSSRDPAPCFLIVGLMSL